MLLAVCPLQAQFHSAPFVEDTAFLFEQSKTQQSLAPRRCQFHGSIGTGIEIGNGYATTYLVASPRVDYHVSDRFVLTAGFTLLGTMDPNRFMLQGRQPRNLAPMREGNASAAIAAYIAGEYQVNDRLWIAASFLRAGGQMIMPTTFTPWGFIPGGWNANVDVTAFSAALRLKVGDDTYIHFQCAYLRDGTGDFMPYYTSPFFHSYMYGMDGLPFGPYGVYGPYGSYSGWNGRLFY